MVNTILKEADLFCPNSVRINFTIYHDLSFFHELGVWACGLTRDLLDKKRR
ncbi:ATP-binding component of an ABC superfamily transporter [Lacticaseibacillus casei UW4]|nr:ATP-binding component of an ABC superfamily transporter [Lacticaseibacillus casei UW4]